MLDMDDDRKLISLIKDYPIIYDPGHKAYMDTAKKVKVWKHISSELKLDPADYQTIRRRWNNMRDIYRKSLKRIHQYTKKGKGIKVYKYAEDLNFIKQYFTKIDGESADETAHDSLCGLPDRLDSRDSTESEEEKEHIDLDYQEVPAKKKRKDMQELVIKLEEPDKSEITFEACDVAPAECATFKLTDDTGGDMHPVDAFLACIKPMLKSFPPYYLSLARSEIFATVHKYELRTLTEPGTSGCNVSSTNTKPSQ